MTTKAADRTGIVRLAEIVGALSLATDLGTGHPIERSLRACLLAVAFGAQLGLDERMLSDVYYVALLRWAGCTADSVRADIFGDELAMGVEIDSVELWNQGEMMDFLRRVIGRGEPPAQRSLKMEEALATGVERAQVAAIANCEIAQNIAARFGIAESAHLALGQLFERWDGGGVPGLVKGEGLSLAVRVVHIAIDAELFHRRGGAEAAVAVLRRRAGGLYDASLVGHFCEESTRLFRTLDGLSPWDAVLAAEPAERKILSDSKFDEALNVIADFTDMRSPLLRGHSRAVARLAEGAAQWLRLPSGEVRAARDAGLVHDVGMAGIPMNLCEKPGPLTEGEWERVRLHPYYTERILARPRALAHVGGIASLHHERMDGSGYHRGLPAALLPPAARVVAAADVYRALVETRAHRPAFAPDEAASELRREVRAGRLDGDAVSAVLAAGGHSVRAARRQQVAGLSEREVEVLVLVALSRTNKQIAQALTLSERTVDHHIRHIYAKVGVSTRAAAAMFAMQHRLLP